MIENVTCEYESIKRDLPVDTEQMNEVDSIPDVNTESIVVHGFRIVVSQEIASSSISGIKSK